MFTNLSRVFTFATSDFSRNIGRSISAIFVLVITIMFVTGLFFSHGITDHIIAEVQNKIDITAYFKLDTPEEDVLNVRDDILKQFPAIKTIEYISREDALGIFKKNHPEGTGLNNGLAQVGEDIFPPSLNIPTTGNPQQDESVANLLQTEKYSDMIYKVDFDDKKATIDKIFSITSTVNNFGLGLAVILVLVVILVVFNTIKLAIDSSKDEISTMTIVGASSWFVRAPFIIQGMLFGCVSFIICFSVTALLAYFSSPSLMGILAGFSLWTYLVSNLVIIIGIQLGFAVALGVISSYIVVQKYLKV